ncbi:MAG: enoyl-CoA hydratase [Myxococcales bacterium]|nr:enoyl-CoA hydratase [Myxococcales bacterium]|tara:strand:- start:1585 stop:2367 length:783 start_codon:yes stop_codon:yes gene_type:complete
MSENLLLTEEADGVLTLTLNRTDVHNALNKPLLLALSAKLEEIAPRQDIRCVIIAGSGEKAFCAGADLKERKGFTMEQTRSFVRKIRGVMDQIERLPMPTIAALDGVAFGGGMEMALACDMRVLSERVKMGLTECALGIIPGAGGTQRLPYLVGASKAKELIFTAKRMTAQEAHELGLANRLVPAGEALKAAQDLASEVAACAPIAVQSAKAAIQGGLGVGMEEGLLLEARCYEVTLYTDDRNEGLRAFAEKRKPNYKGV